MPPPNIPTGPRGAASKRGGRGGFQAHQTQPPRWAATQQATASPVATPQSPSAASAQQSSVYTPAAPGSTSSQSQSRARSESTSAASPLALNGAASPSPSNGMVAESDKDGASVSAKKEGASLKEKDESVAAESAEESDDMDMGSDDEDDFTGKTPLAQIQNSQVFYGRRGRGGRGGLVATRGRGLVEVEPDKFEETSAILETLDTIGMPYVFISRVASMSSQINVGAIRRHFGCFLPLWVRSDAQGWYVAFNSKDAANRCKMVLDKANLSGFQISIAVKPPLSGVTDRRAVARPSRSQAEIKKPTRKRPKITWTDEELAEAASEIILKELGDVFSRDLKNRVVNPFVSEFLGPSGSGGKFLSNPPSNLIAPRGPRYRRRDEDEEIEEGEVDVDGRVRDETNLASSASGSALPSFKKKQVKQPPAPKQPLENSKLSKWSLAPSSLPPGPPPGPPPLSAQEQQREMGDKVIAAAYAKIQERKAQLEAEAEQKQVASVEEMRKEMEKDEDLQNQVVAEAHAQAEQEKQLLENLEAEAPVTKKRGGKKAKGKKGKKEEVEAGPLIEQVDTPMEVVNDGVPESEKALLEKLKQVETMTPPTIDVSRPRSPTPDPFEIGIAETDEDLYYVQIALERMCAGEAVVPEGAGDNAGLVAGLAPSAAGAAGSGEGLNLGQRVHSSGSARTQGFYRIPPSQKAAHLPDRNTATVDASTVSNHALASARNNRADSRKVLLGIEQHKKDTATDTDILKFNQLGSRKKQLRFSKSPIHDWGLYAMELIPAGDMVIEYVGEVVRQQVADNREKQYERQVSKEDSRDESRFTLFPPNDAHPALRTGWPSYLSIILPG